MTVTTDESAFAELVERHRHELRVHCYRMLGSYDEAEDIVQETFLRAWRKRDTFSGRSTFRAWLYKIATNACLDFLAARKRKVRPHEGPPLVESASMHQPPPNVHWLEPFPDSQLDVATDQADQPEAVVVARETIELAFLVAIQQLPPKQRAVLITRDVLGWSAEETSQLLDTSVAAVKSALQRARATLKHHLPRQRDDWAASSPTEDERRLVRRYIDAHQRADLDGVARLLAEDVRLTMPPEPAWLIGKDALLALTAQVFDPRSTWHHGGWRGVATRANRQPAVAHYVERPSAPATAEMPGRFRAQVLDVLEVVDGELTAVTSFGPEHFPAFDLPLTL